MGCAPSTSAHVNAQASAATGAAVRPEAASDAGGVSLQAAAPDLNCKLAVGAPAATRIRTETSKQLPAPAAPALPSSRATDEDASLVQPTPKAVTTPAAVPADESGAHVRQPQPAATAAPAAPAAAEAKTSQAVTGLKGRRGGARVHVCGAAADLLQMRYVMEDLSGAVELCGGDVAEGPIRACERRGVDGECECSALLFVASAASVSDKVCLDALDRAIDAGRDVLPFFTESPEAVLAAAPDGLDMRLRQFQWTRPLGKAGDAGYGPRLEALAEALQRAARRRPPPPAADGPYHGLRRAVREEAREPPGPTWSHGDLPADAPATRVFVSYAHADASVVRSVKDALIARGLSCWFDEMQLAAGMRWVDEVARAVRNCTHLVLFASAKSVASQYCGEEFAYAYDLERRIVVCYLEDREDVARSAPAALAARLRRLPSCSIEPEVAATAEVIASHIASGARFELAADGLGKDVADLDQIALSHEADNINDPLLGPLAKFARNELERDDLTTGLAVYVPPKAADRAKKQFDLHAEAVAFLRQFAVGPQDGAAGDDPRLKLAKHRVLLLLGDAGTSKSTFFRFLHREACRLWARGEPPAGERLPPTVLVPLPELVGAPGGVLRGLRDFVAGRLGVPGGELPLLRRRSGLVLLLDGYDESGEKSNFWTTNKLGDWASGVFVSCRTEYLASLARENPEHLFAPSNSLNDDTLDVRRLRQLTTLPFSRAQVDEFLGKYVLLHAREEGAWPFERYSDELRRTPGLASLVENPFTLSLLAFVLPSRAADNAEENENRRALRSRELYRCFIDDWLRRELGRDLHGPETGKRGGETELLEAGSDMCRRLAVLLFRMGKDQAIVPARGLSGARGTDDEAESIAAVDPLQRACEQLLGDKGALFVRNSCPLRRWRSAAGGSLGFAFLHKTLGEFLVAEALLESLDSTAGVREDLEAVNLSMRSIVEAPTLLRFLAEAVQYEPETGVAAALLRHVEQSRDVPPEVDNAPELVAAANAASILVLGHYSFAGRDMRGVRVPRANLWRLEAAGADLRGTDLRFCSLSEACLAGASIGGTRFDDCKISAYPASMHDDFVNTVAWMPDGKRIVSGSRDKSVRVWDAESGAELLRLQGHTDEIMSVAISADGKWIVTGSRDKQVRLCNAVTGAVVRHLEGHTSDVVSVAVLVSTDGKRIASGSVDNSVRVWDADSGKELLQLQGHTDVVWSVQFSADGKRIVSGSRDASVRVWDAESGAELLQLQGHTAGVTSVAGDGMRIVSGSKDASLRVWDAASGAELLQLQGHTGYVRAAALSTDGKRIVSGSADSSVRVWDSDSGTELLQLQGHTGHVTSVAISADGKRIASASEDKSVRVWAADTSTEFLQLQGHASDVWAVALMADGKRIVSGGKDKSVRVWDAESGAELLQLEGHTREVRSVVASADGKRIVSGGKDNLVRVWDVESGAELLQLQGHTNDVATVALSADNRRIVSGGSDGSVRLWDAESGKEVLNIQSHTNGVTSVALSPDGKRIVSGNRDRLVQVWDARSGKRLLELQGHAGTVESVALSADGKRIVSGSGDASVRVWDAEPGAERPGRKRSGKELLQLRGHKNIVWSVAVSEDGKRIVSGSEDKTVRVWDAESGAELLRLHGHADGVWAVAVSADGRRVVSGARDGSVRVWDVDEAQAQHRCTRRVARTAHLEARGARMDAATALEPRLRLLLLQLGAVEDVNNA